LRRTQQGGQLADREFGRALYPRRGVVRGCDAREQPHVHPREHARLERLGERRQGVEPRSHARELLDLARAEAEPLACVIADAGETEALVALQTQEDGSQTPDDAPAERLLPAEPAQPRVEHVGPVPPVDPAGLLASGNPEEIGRDGRGIADPDGGVR
jgi:hypothetical protein